MAEKNAAQKNCKKQTAIVLNTTQKQQKMEFCEVKKIYTHPISFKQFKKANFT